jgi:aspartate/methionine/tyrosine aminotransferase
MSEHHDLPYLTWARAHVGRQRICLRGSGMPGRALPSPLPTLPQAPAGQDDRWHERQLGAAIATRYGADPAQVFVALGTSGANAAVLSVLAQPRGGEPAELLCERPAYDPLWRTGLALGAQVHFFQRRAEDGWRIDPLALEAQLSHQTRAVILTRPHNPTGVDTPEADLHALGEMAEAHDLRIVVDEVYLDFLPGARPAFSIHPRLISTSSLTKVYGQSELRLGWAIADPALVDAMVQRRLHGESLLPVLPHAVALALWDQLDGWRDEARAQARHGAAIFHEALSDIPTVRLAPHAHTPFGFVQAGGDDQALTTALEAQGLGVTPGSLFHGPGGLRIGWTHQPKLLHEGAAILRQILLSRG